MQGSTVVLAPEDFVDVFGGTEHDLVIELSRATALFELPDDAQGLGFSFTGAPPVEWLTLATEPELLGTLSNLRSPEHPGRLAIVWVRREAQSLGVLDGLFHQLAGARRFAVHHGKASHVMIPDAATVVLGVTRLIHRQLGAQTEHIEEEDTGLCAPPAGLEPGDDHPAQTLAKEIRRPKCFVGRCARSSVEELRHGGTVAEPPVPEQSFDATPH